MTNLKGDCDTRTLLLYTILSHYNYDVAVSSEFYGHSILGINLPIMDYHIQPKTVEIHFMGNYSVGSKPGIISNDISNTNYLENISKSK